MTPLINGEAFDFGQIIVNIAGVPIPSVTSIEYGQEQEKKRQLRGRAIADFPRTWNEKSVMLNGYFNVRHSGDPRSRAESLVVRCSAV